MITIRPVYDLPHRRRSLANYHWGVYVDGVLTVITRRYPSDLVQGNLS